MPSDPSTDAIMPGQSPPRLDLRLHPRAQAHFDAHTTRLSAELEAARASRRAELAARGLTEPQILACLADMDRHHHRTLMRIAEEARRLPAVAAWP